ncbi:ParB/RepB/Spo0J family partition protein [Parvularcula dongshanensis]|uniref:ParB family chromosome partitioning protein n=1 Tax=Parvularcula dongshanensis TaxID=1173995 RepID=A0A840HYV5_9PROT|nr:ParB/RepB/Spo0J family partition protein [Parvularcula dongshanensis]MBB4658026.1 ParB family chromosome partitioning protein [Parvularcula dongshanensis]
MAKKGLGRGLEAILGDTQALRSGDEGQGPSVAMIPIAELSADPDQPRKRFDDTELSSLSDSIKRQGILQPILVQPKRNGAYIIIAGERRWRAAQRAGIHEVPVLIREGTADSAAELALIENIQRVDLNPIEEADAYARMRDAFGRKPQEIADAVGKSRSHVANMMRLTSLPDSVRSMVTDGRLSMGHARALLSAKEPEKLAARVVKKDLSVRETERLAAGRDASATAEKESAPTAGKKPRASSGSKDADTKALERDLEAALGLTVAIDHQGKAGGEIRIDYETLDQLDDICSRLMRTYI